MDSTRNRQLAPLPPQFADLAAWQEEWALPSEWQRFARRVDASDLEELRPFYEAMLNRMPEIMDHLATLPVDPSDAGDKQLLLLALSYVEISRCFEAWSQVDVRADFFKPEQLHTDG